MKLQGDNTLSYQLSRESVGSCLVSRSKRQIEGLSPNKNELGLSLLWQAEKYTAILTTSLPMGIDP